FARRGLSLIETVMVVLVLSIAIPPSLTIVDHAVEIRADAVSLTRATALANGIMEHVLADVHSEHASLGFAAMIDDAAYIEGLNTRIAPLADAMQPFGVTARVIVGPLADASGTVSGDGGADLFRVVRVEVDYPSAAAGTQTLALECVVTGFGL
ncbi:MAG: hypothetical protein AAF747_02445, partial [Planctomycetota bacterium]